MTTQTSFDLSGLIHAIESYNSGYQIALYAEHAQVQIIDRDHSEPAPRIVAGRPAIARWIDDMAAPDIVHHIVDAKAHRIRQTLDMTTVLGLSGDEAAHPSPQGVILSRDGRFAFITLKALGKVAVINIATGAVVKTLAVGGGSDGVGYSPVAARTRPAP